MIKSSDLIDTTTEEEVDSMDEGELQVEIDLMMRDIQQKEKMIQEITGIFFKKTINTYLKLVCRIFFTL